MSNRSTVGLIFRLSTPILSVDYVCARDYPPRMYKCAKLSICIYMHLWCAVLCGVGGSAFSCADVNSSWKAETAHLSTTLSSSLNHGSMATELTNFCPLKLMCDRSTFKHTSTLAKKAKCLLSPSSFFLSSSPYSTDASFLPNATFFLPSFFNVCPSCTPQDSNLFPLRAFLSFLFSHASIC